MNKQWETKKEVIKILNQIKKCRKELHLLAKCKKKATSEMELNDYNNRRKLLWEKENELRKELNKLLEE